MNICISEILYNSSCPILGFLFMEPERSFGDESLLCALLFSFLLAFRRECRLLNGSTACLLGAFVLKGVLSSQTKKNLFFPQDIIHKANSLIELEPASNPLQRSLVWFRKVKCPVSLLILDCKKKDVDLINSYNSYYSEKAINQSSP